MIGIIGCGWLGKPLAIKLQNEGKVILGSCTNEEKLCHIQKEIPNMILLNLNEEVANLSMLELKKIKTLFINIPPSKSKSNTYENQIEQLIDFCPNAEKIIFVSSTSVYENNNQIAVESDVVNGNQSLINAEKLVLSHSPKNTILRYAGLTGPDRNLARFFAGKDNCNSPHNAVNLIHLTDAVQIAHEFIANNYEGIYNVCSPEHPTRELYYTQLCNKMNLPLPLFSENNAEKNKIISSEKLLNDLNYNFAFPNPLHFTY